MRFIFPQDIEGYRQIKCIQLLKERLSLESQKLHFVYKYKLLIQKGKYIYLKCRQCFQKMTFKQEQNQLKLTYFGNIHQHKKSLRNSLIQQFILSMPSTIIVSSLMKITTKQFAITKSKFYYHFRKVFQDSYTVYDTLQQLNRDNYQTRYIPYPLQKDQLPSIFITASPKMMQNFHEYGQFITFDITYNLIKQYQAQTMKKWGLGMFLGKNNFNAVVPFGVCLINREDNQTFVNLFLSFFDIMGSKPQAILTDEQTSIKSALKLLKYQDQWNGYHILDSFHVIKNIRKKTKNKILITCLTNAILSWEQQQYLNYLNKAKQSVENPQDNSVVRDFIDKSEVCCYSCIPRCFHGFHTSTSYHQKVNDYIKQHIQYQKPMSLVIRKTLKILEELQDKSQKQVTSKIPYENIFQNIQLKIIRHLVCSTVMEKIITNYVKGLQIKYRQISHNIWIVQNHKEQIVVEEQNKLLKCSCQFQAKCGIPCAHIIPLILDLHEDISNYINKRWFIIKQQSKKQYSVRNGRPRNSRRRKA